MKGDCDSIMYEVDGMTQELETESVEIQSLLDALSLDMMKDNITNQVYADSPSNTNFLDIVLDKFNVILSDDSIDESDKSEIKSQMIDFCADLVAVISDEFGLGINVLGDDYESHVTLLSALYEVLVMYRYEFVETFFVNYIRANSSMLISSLGLSDSSKDISTIAYKKKNMSDEDVIILSNLGDIISYITNNGLADCDEFLTFASSGEESISNLSSYYEDGTVCGDFTNTLLNTVVGVYDSNNFTNLRNDIRIALVE